ncbi:hypothetical protein [Phytoactinopolyspora limicola]|uniref:hypothetical protein n=1 Tax=Phytoactinopolyspora limicola TaxID=2715536 RepID=UPI00140E801F|nr:hypothetical protein [Phytoactinopolyspora limicola]
MITYERGGQLYVAVELPNRRGHETHGAISTAPLHHHQCACGDVLPDMAGDLDRSVGEDETPEEVAEQIHRQASALLAADDRAWCVRRLRRAVEAILVDPSVLAEDVQDYDEETGRGISLRGHARGLIAIEATHYPQYIDDAAGSDPDPAEATLADIELTAAQRAAVDEWRRIQSERLDVGEWSSY